MLLAEDARVGLIHAWSRHPVRATKSKIVPAAVDITDEASIAKAADAVKSAHLVVVATGLLHSPDGLEPEKTWRDLDLGNLTRSFAINTIGPALVAKHLLPLMPRNERAIFAAISARVGSIGDNRLGGWYGYRASKAALNQMIKTLSIELARSGPQSVCVGLHPGTVDTDLSGPFQANVPKRNLFSSERAARQLLNVLGGLTPSDTGNLFAWDGTQVPF
jgi:NAD(P)-dependent dehydrogenase (short-subunit alcohol dehydrogenase family)